MSAEAAMNSAMVDGTQSPGLAKSKLTPLRNGASDDANTSENLWHLSKLQADGLIKNLGVTNVDLAHLRMLHSSGYRLATNQVSMSVLDRRAQDGGMAQWCSENGVALLAYGTLLGGFLSEKWHGKPEPSGQQLNSPSLQKYKRFIDAAGGWEPFQTLLEAVAGVATKHGVSIGAVATRYVLQQPAVAAVIVGSRLDADAAGQYIKSDIAACSSPQDGRQFKLDDSDMAAIAKAQEGLKPVPNDCGDEYRWPPFLTATGDLSAHLDTTAEDKQLEEIERVIAAGGRVQRSSGSPWEPVAGYCRGVRIGSSFVIAGTTTRAHPSGKGWIGGSSYADQATYCFDLVTGAVRALGASMGDVMRTRAILTSLDDYQGVMRAHGQTFRPHGTRPGYTMIGNNTLVGDGILVEIEVDGVIRGAGRDAPLLMI